jgi:hypothetical protein
MSYWEYSSPYGYLIDNVSVHNWNSSVSYAVYQSSTNPNIWCAYIAGVQVRCADLNTPGPFPVQALSELKIDDKGTLDTRFQDVLYRGNDGVWRQFDQDKFYVSDSRPYAAAPFGGLFDYRTTGPNNSFVSPAMKQ